MAMEFTIVEEKCKLEQSLWMAALAFVLDGIIDPRLSYNQLKIVRNLINKTMVDVDDMDVLDNLISQKEKY